MKAMSPEAVIVGGRIERAWPAIARGVKNAVEKIAFRGLPSASIIVTHSREYPPLSGRAKVSFDRHVLPLGFPGWLLQGFGLFPDFPIDQITCILSESRFRIASSFDFFNERNANVKSRGISHSYGIDVA